MEVVWRLLELSWDVYRSDGPSSELVAFSVSAGRRLYIGPTDRRRWVYDRGDLAALVPSARFNSCVTGVTAMGQSLRQRAGRLSADREISRSSAGGIGAVGERILKGSPVGVIAGENVRPLRSPLALSGIAIPGVVAQDSGSSTTRVKCMDLERSYCKNLCLPSLWQMCEQDVMW